MTTLQDFKNNANPEVWEAFTTGLNTADDIIIDYRWKLTKELHKNFDMTLPTYSVLPTYFDII